MTLPAVTAPPAIRSPAGPARDKILATAFRLFYAQGFRAAGIDTIIAESGVAKATFYKYFPAKDDLILAYLEKVDGVWTGQLHAAADAAGQDPAAQLVGLFDALTTACRRDGYRGCAFINAAAESAAGTRVHDRTVAHKQQIRAWIRGLAARRRRQGPGPARPQPDPAARRRPGQRGARRRSGGRHRRPGHRRPTCGGKPGAPRSTRRELNSGRTFGHSW